MKGFNDLGYGLDVEDGQPRPWVTHTVIRLSARYGAPHHRVRYLSLGSSAGADEATECSHKRMAAHFSQWKNRWNVKRSFWRHQRFANKQPFQVEWRREFATMSNLKIMRDANLGNSYCDMTHLFQHNTVKVPGSNVRSRGLLSCPVDGRDDLKRKGMGWAKSPWVQLQLSSFCYNTVGAIMLLCSVGSRMKAHFSSDCSRQFGLLAPPCSGCCSSRKRNQEDRRRKTRKGENLSCLPRRGGQSTDRLWGESSKREAEEGNRGDETRRASESVTSYKQILRCNRR